MQYRAKHLKRLTAEARTRFEKLVGTIDSWGCYENETLHIDPVEVRLAVDDFKSILAEIRRLK